MPNNKSIGEGIKNAVKDIKSTFSNPDTRQEISEKAAKENAARQSAFDKEVEELRKKNPSPGNFEKAVYRKIQDAHDEETKQQWRNVLMKKTAPNKDNKIDVKNNNIPQAQVDNTKTYNNTTKEKPANIFKEGINTAVNKVKESASGVANNIAEGVKGNKDDTTTTDETTTTDDTKTTDDTTTT